MHETRPTSTTESRAGRRIAAWLGGSVLVVILVVAALFVTRDRAGGPDAAVERWRSMVEETIGDPSVVLITVDTLRADRLSCYGYAGIETFNICGLGDQGTRFENAATTVPFTLPAHSSIMTGSYPPYHGVRENVGYSLADGVPTLAEMLGALGYDTAGFVSAFVLDARWGIGRGFERYYDEFDLGTMEQSNLGSVQRDGAETVAEALRWLDGRDSGPPFFLWLHLFEPHDPYTPPEPYLSRYPGRPYDGEVAYADALVGRFLDGLRSRGLLDLSVVVLTGDHGEGLGDHDEAFHGYFVYDTTTRIPLLVRLPPGAPAGRVVRQPASHVDLLPTVLDAIGEPMPSLAHGRSLLPLLLADGDGEVSGADSSSGMDAADGAIYSESTYPLNHYGWAPLHSLRTERYKLIDAPRGELYDLVADPSESNNLYEREGALVAELRETLARLREQIQGDGDAATRIDMDEETLAMLRSLGYIVGGGAGATTDPEAERADPKDKIRLHRLIMQAQSDIGAGNEEAAEVRLAELVADDPTIVDAWQMLGNIYNHRGEHDRAITHFRAALELNSEHNAALFGLAEAYRQLGRFEEAIAGYGQLLNLNPSDVKATLAIARIRVDQGHVDDALSVVEDAMLQDSPPAILYNQRGELRALLGQVPTALEDFRQAARLAPDFAQPLFNLGVLAEEQGDLDGAVQRYEETLGVAPRHYQAQFNLGRVYGELGQFDRQEQLYQAAIESNPDFARGYFFLAKAIMDRDGDLARAEALTQQGIERDPEDRAGPLGYFLLADILGRLGRPDEARQALERAREIQSRGRG